MKTPGGISPHPCDGEADMSLTGLVYDSRHIIFHLSGCAYTDPEPGAGPPGLTGRAYLSAGTLAEAVRQTRASVLMGAQPGDVRVAPCAAALPGETGESHVHEDSKCGEIHCTCCCAVCVMARGITAAVAEQARER